MQPQRRRHTILNAANFSVSLLLLLPTEKMVGVGGINEDGSLRGRSCVCLLAACPTVPGVLSGGGFKSYLQLFPSSDRVGLYKD